MHNALHDTIQIMTYYNPEYNPYHYRKQSKWLHNTVQTITLYNPSYNPNHCRAIASCVMITMIWIVSSSVWAGQEGAISGVSSEFRFMWVLMRVVCLSVDYHKSEVVLENNIWTFINSAGTKNPQLNGTNNSIFLNPNNLVIRIDFFLFLFIESFIDLGCRVWGGSD